MTKEEVEADMSSISEDIDSLREEFNILTEILRMKGILDWGISLTDELDRLQRMAKQREELE